MNKIRRKSLKIPIRQTKEYDLNQSPFFKLVSIKKLLSILRVSQEELKDILDNPTSYYSIRIENNRDIQSPKKYRILYRIHNRIAHHLRAIITPDYLFSDKKGCSIYDNAIVHFGCKMLLNVDISKFFPSTNRNKIYSFFKYSMQCSSEISDIMSYLCSINNHIPTGSQISMRLAYLVNKKLFDDLYKFAKDKNLKMSVWVDDVSFSGDKIDSSVIYVVEKIIKKHGFNVSKNKTQIRHSTENKSVTGIFISGDIMEASEELYKKRRIKLREWRNFIKNKEISLKELEKVKDSLLGLLNYLNLFEPSSSKYIALIKNDFLSYSNKRISV
ncbi:reverse transcriptase family protein [Actinobacillus equuli]|nr:reverse transcriptase family protein [Actinobacillus equuli]AIZ79730.1 hypothetical protein ACEE_08095 [Actinobacillus equuli subsp. equuli]WGE43840.1 reverse transcriptase family protein [Actinobacillus equuli subsp. equuli]WGE52293.1 reverse transcriptase family protein [Actinobacillus equuli subsp. haemolyticus]WGE72788.1 reverse transcriptase family protein [Actinobacillus equuli subsp. haemolyticus]